MHKRHLLQIAVSVFAVILMSFSAWAVPGIINYQGRLTDPNGVALEGDYEMGFSLYNTETGGSDIWNETQTVRITNGIYNVQLGAVNPLSIDLFNDDTLYLEVRIDNEVLYPRDTITSTAFAMRAGVADMAIDAGTVGGIQPGDLLDTSSSSQTKAGGLNIGGKLGIGTDTPSGALHVNGTSILEGTLNIDTKQEGTTSLDQSQTSKQLTSFLNADWQSFTANMEGILTRIEVLSVEAWSWGSTTLRIYEGEGTSGASLYEWQYDIGITVSDGIVAFDIPIESGPGLSSGSQYTFQIENIDGLVWVEYNNPYAGGRSSFGADRDFWFKTYMRIGYKPGGVVTVTPDGNVGIGTMSPGELLEVNGNIKATNFVGNGSSLTGVVIAETDPCVPNYLKDGVNWSEISNRPSGLDDGDNIGITSETDPQVGSNTKNYIPKWNGSAIVTGTIYDNGKIGIGTTSPSHLLTLYGSGPQLSLADRFGSWELWGGDNLHFRDDGVDRVFFGGNGNVGIGTGTTFPSYKLHVNGTAYATGAAGALSDRRHKTNISDLSLDAIEVVNALSPVSFEWKEPQDSGMEGSQLGFIAQEVEAILPEAVLTQDNDEQTKGLKYNALIPVLTKAIQELAAENVVLKEKIEALESALQL